MMKNTTQIIVILSLFVFYIPAYSQQIYIQQIPVSDKFDLHATLSLDDKVSYADAIIEGHVISGREYGMPDGFFGPKGPGVIFTSIIVRVTKIFKGEIKDTIIELVTDGGRSSDGLSTSSSWGLLTKGQEGILFLRPNNTAIQSGKSIQSFLYLSPKSVMLYQEGQPYYPVTHDGMKRYNDLEEELYPAIEAIVGTPAKVVGVRSFKEQAKKQ